jgi:hypothetical protein
MSEVNVSSPRRLEHSDASELKALPSEDLKTSSLEYTLFHIGHEWT